MNVLLVTTLFYTPFVATMVCPGLGFAVSSMFLFYHYTHRGLSLKLKNETYN